MSDGLSTQERRALLLLAKNGEEGMAEDRLMKVHRFKMPVLLGLATRGYISIRSRRFQDYEVLASAARVHITKMGRAAITIYSKRHLDRVGIDS